MRALGIFRAFSILLIVAVISPGQESPGLGQSGYIDRAGHLVITLDFVPAGDFHRLQIVQGGAFKRTGREVEARGQDDIGGNAEAGRESQDCARVLRNIGLVEGKAHVERCGNEPRHDGGAAEAAPLA